MRKILAPVLLIAALGAGCRTAVPNTPTDEILNWSDAEAAFTTAVRSVTIALNNQSIDASAGRRIKPFIEEGDAVLEKAYKAIDATPADQDPVIDVTVSRTLLSLATRITAMLALEQNAAKAAKPAGGTN